MGHVKGGLDGEGRGEGGEGHKVGHDHHLLDPGPMQIPYMSLLPSN